MGAQLPKALSRGCRCPGPTAWPSHTPTCSKDTAPSRKHPRAPSPLQQPLPGRNPQAELHRAPAPHPHPARPAAPTRHRFSQWFIRRKDMLSACTCPGRSRGMWTGPTWPPAAFGRGPGGSARLPDALPPNTVPLRGCPRAAPTRPRGGHGAAGQGTEPSSPGRAEKQDNLQLLPEPSATGVALQGTIPGRGRTRLCPAQRGEAAHPPRREGEEEEPPLLGGQRARLSPG